MKAGLLEMRMRAGTLGRIMRHNIPRHPAGIFIGRILKRRLFLSLAFALSFCGAASAKGTTLLIEAEALEAFGGWVQGEGGRGAKAHLVSGTNGRALLAAGAVNVPHAGAWRIWVRSKDYAKDRPGTRNFTVRFGNARLERKFGMHGRDGLEGWDWEDGGTVMLSAGPTLVVIGDESTPFARCDALVMTDDPNWKPRGLPAALRIQRAQNVPLERRMVAAEAPVMPGGVEGSLIEPRPETILENEAVRFVFFRAARSGCRDKIAAGKPSEGGNVGVIVVKVEMRSGNGWIPFEGNPEAEEYRIVSRPEGSDPRLSGQVHPTWNSSLSEMEDVGAGGVWVRTMATPASAPWGGGRCVVLRPTAVHRLDSNSVELEFPSVEAGRLRAVWRIENGRSPEVSIELVLAGVKAGHVSLGYHSAVACPPDKADFMLLPPMYHGRRFPDKPKVLLSATTPTPIALLNRGGASLALVAEPSELMFEWPASDNSRYLFGLRGEQGQAQPLIYSPVLGLPGSKVGGGASVRSKFRLRVQSGEWYAAWRDVAETVYGLTDYRRPVHASLSDTALNLFDLLRDDRASGWDPRVKGSYNIESRNIASHASPLTFLSYYLLTGDQEFYRKRALPALEYLVSRPGAHFGAEREIGANYYKHQRMQGPVGVYGASVFASAYMLTQGRTPAFVALSMDAGGRARETRGYSHVQPWEDLVGLYQISGDKTVLKDAIAGGDRYIRENLTKLPTRDLGPVPFVNMTFVPDWEGLLHLYEASGEKRFLEAAVEGARWLLTTLWVQPRIPEGMVTIHKGGSYDHARHVWYFGDKRYRLGIVEGAASSSDPTKEYKLPPTLLPERSVPAWQVSNVGLGLEQPSTYTRRGRHANILMSTWAPNLLRLAALSGDPLFRTAARNATIGRFGNYPGYYADGMTDLYSYPEYPFRGPDVTTIYHHHIAPFAAYVLDYLFTDAEVRSAGAVKFPWVRQCGYVWFDARLRGHAPGSVYGQPAWPWLHRTAATVDNVAVDRILAHGNGRFFVILLNQTNEGQRARVHFDPVVLKRTVRGAILRRWNDNREDKPLQIAGDSVDVSLSPGGIVVLSMDGTRIEVPTHQSAPPDRVMSRENVSENVIRKTIPGTTFGAVGMEFQVPPFAWRDLYVYLAAGIDDARKATLRYRVGDGPERCIEDNEYPWEFSVRVDDMKAPVVWSVSVER